MELDGQILTGAGATVPLADDGATHTVRVVLSQLEHAAPM